MPVNQTALQAGVTGAAVDTGLPADRHRPVPPAPFTLGGRAAGAAPAHLRPADHLRGGLERRRGLAWRPSRIAARARRGAAGAAVRVESLEDQHRLYSSSVVDGEHADDPDTLLALELNGETLDLDHGYPVRLIAPDRPGVLQTKWISKVVVL